LAIPITLFWPRPSAQQETRSATSRIAAGSLLAYGDRIILASDDLQQPNSAYFAMAIGLDFVAIDPRLC
jgi:hypothetical protein